MNSAEINALALKLLAGDLPLEAFVDQLAQPASAPLGEATLDLDRARRCGYPEVVYGEGKSPETLEKIFHRLHEASQPVLATRVTAEKAEILSGPFPTGRYNPLARTFRVPLPTSDDDAVATAEGDHWKQPSAQPGRVALVTAGTSDLAVAEEARETLDWMGIPTIVIHDVGVAGPHRLPEQLPKLSGAAAVVVVAGMEGALPSVVGGYVDCPVIAVPTSVGYGASLGGMAALLGMLNSCAANVTVVNIDAGFKGGYVAGMIARQVNKKAD